jgi:hypothetical protein
VSDDCVLQTCHDADGSEKQMVPANSVVQKSIGNTNLPRSVWIGDMTNQVESAEMDALELVRIMLGVREYVEIQWESATEIFSAGCKRKPSVPG